MKVLIPNSVILRRKVPGPIMYCLLLIFISVSLRIPYAHAVLEQFSQLSIADQTSYQMGYLAPDSPGYIDPQLPEEWQHCGSHLVDKADWLSRIPGGFGS